ETCFPKSGLRGGNLYRQRFGHGQDRGKAVRYYHYRPEDERDRRNAFPGANQRDCARYRCRSHNGVCHLGDRKGVIPKRGLRFCGQAVQIKRYHRYRAAAGGKSPCGTILTLLPKISLTGCRCNIMRLPFISLRRQRPAAEQGLEGVRSLFAKFRRIQKNNTKVLELMAE